MSKERLTLLMDGACPLCRREAGVLRRLDRGRGLLELVDISAPGFEPSRHGLTMGELMAEIHGVTAGGVVVRGMEVFRRAYAAVGLGWALAPTGWPIIRPLADAAYAWFARNRLRLTGRQQCAEGRCGATPPEERKRIMRNHHVERGRSGSRAWRKVSCIVAAALFPLASGCGLIGAGAAPLSTVENVDLELYQGIWYEIARYPNSFERDCVGTTAEYTIRDDGTVEVVNTCLSETLDGPARTIEGSARSIDESNAKLKVTFFAPFEGDYWILDLDEDYQYAVVGEPSRLFFWILSRTPTLDEATLDMIIARMPEWGYEPANLYFVPQAEP